ncbi:hypothetical protein BOTCAL_1298g00020 [Botryotinia calthae]|uniref:Uncharacterized protein n=1 Tax=Botryotinia calthae TaxID=38488 RepID=A0A4Y8CCN0_9HELO|nr:hypothetical protein BOTCAL_1298g00020 [Botryotinia calthae]
MSLTKRRDADRLILRLVRHPPLQGIEQGEELARSVVPFVPAQRLVEASTLYGDTVAESVLFHRDGAFSELEHQRLGQESFLVGPKSAQPSGAGDAHESLLVGAVGGGQEEL